MTTALQVHGAIDRNEPDPRAPHDPLIAWIGMVKVTWVEGDRQAAILRAATGRGTGDRNWGPYAMLLRWIGDPPPPEIAQAVYDLVHDGGPGRRTLSVACESQPRTPAQPSYRAARA